MAAEKQEKKVPAPCSSCLKETAHRVLFEEARHDEDRIETFGMLSCAGCGTISLGVQTRLLPNGELEYRYYPSPVSRKVPTWSFLMRLGLVGGEGEEVIGDLLHEIHQAVSGDMHRLAAMGIRALIEQLMISKVGDRGSFAKNLGAFYEQRYISLPQHDAIKALVEAGHAVIHRSFKPTADDLNLALDIVEGILAAIYEHSPHAARLSDRVPPRPNDCSNSVGADKGAIRSSCLKSTPPTPSPPPPRGLSRPRAPACRA